MNDLDVETRERVAWITLNRPDRLNAFSQAMIASFASALDQVAADPGVRVCVITGAGRAFSAGIDLVETGSALSGPADVERQEHELRRLQDVTRKLLALPQPVICALNGLAVGMGAEISIATDIRIAAESAYYLFAEVKRGLFQTNGVMYLLPRIVGHGRAMDMLLSGARIPARDALAAGLVTRVVPDAQLAAAAAAAAATLVENAPISMRLIKHGMLRAHDLDLEGVLQLEEDGMRECLRSDDIHEGVRAFNEKRPPRFTGR